MNLDDDDVADQPSLSLPLPARADSMDFNLSVFDDVCNLPAQMRVDDIKAELDAYFDAAVPEKMDVLLQWRANHTHFKRLAVIARRVFAVPASSVAASDCSPSSNTS